MAGHSPIVIRGRSYRFQFPSSFPNSIERYLSISFYSGVCVPPHNLPSAQDSSPIYCITWQLARGCMIIARDNMSKKEEGGVATLLLQRPLVLGCLCGMQRQTHIASCFSSTRKQDEALKSHGSVPKCGILAKTARFRALALPGSSHIFTCVGTRAHCALCTFVPGRWLARGFEADYKITEIEQLLFKQDDCLLRNPISASRNVWYAVLAPVTQRMSPSNSSVSFNLTLCQRLRLIEKYIYLVICLAATDRWEKIATASTPRYATDPAIVSIGTISGLCMILKATSSCIAVA